MNKQDSSNSDLLHISLIIDEFNKTRLDIHPNDPIEELVKVVSIKYQLSEKVNQHLVKFVKNFVSEAKLKQKEETKARLKERIEKNIDKLYYKESENKKLKEQLKQKIKEQDQKQFIDSCTFSPQVNFFPKTIFERKHLKIEEKLMKDGENLKERLMLKKIRANLINSSKNNTSPKKKYCEISKVNILKDKEIPNFFEKKPIVDSKVFELGLNLNEDHQRRQTANFNIFPGSEVDNLILLKQTSNNDHSITPSNNNHRRMTLMSNKSKLTYKSLYMQLKEDKYGKQNSIRSVTESFESSREENLNIPALKNDNLYKPQKLINSNSLQHKDNNGKRDSIFINNKDTSNRNVCQFNIKDSSFKESFFNPNNRRASTKEISYLTEAIKKSTNTFKQNGHFTNLTAETATTLTIVKYSPKKLTPNKSSTARKKASNLNSENEKERIKSCKERIIKLKNSSKDKKNLSKLFLNSKSEKETAKNIHEYLHKNAKNQKINKELFAEEVIKKQCTFSPNSSKYTTKLTKLEKDALVSRLVNSKKIKTYALNFSKNSLFNENSVDNTSTSHTPVINNSQFPGGRGSQLKTLYKECTTENSTYMQSCEDHASNHSSRKYLNTSNFEKTLKDRLEKSFEKHKTIESTFSREFANKSQENIHKFTLNNLKEIFEVIFNSCESIDDIISLEAREIPEKVKQMLVIPCCSLMKQRNLDFNFQNFFLIANEIMKKVI
jgi:hypothetical protein